ncbi:MAG: hypothetical protein ACI8WA_001634 [Polaribacter sp.]
MSLFAKSCNEFAGVSTVTIPSEIGVIKAVYLLSLILLKILVVALVTITSLKEKF